MSVMKIMGGRVVRIRKSRESIQDAYLRDQEWYDACTLSEGAKKLGCHKRTLRNMRQRLPKRNTP